MRTLNEMLGMTYHLSTLRRKLIRLSLSDSKQWQTLAVQRGCKHYPTVSDPVCDPGLEMLSNEELGLALLLGELPYDPQAIRVAAQLLSGEIDVDEVLEIAERERLGHLLHRIAEDILSFGIELKNWSKMLESTKPRDFPIGVLPHRSRYIADQGNYVPKEERYQILKPSRVLDEATS
jgi:hypothetical protein